MITFTRKNTRLEELTAAVLQEWPEHEGFLRRGFDSRSSDLMEFTYQIAEAVYHISKGDVQGGAADYHWVCDRLFEEEINFRQTGAYRYVRAEDASKAVYQNRPYMDRYMRGLLYSQLFWSNHTSVIHHYIESYLPLLPTASRHLEIGPGHGLFLSRAAKSGCCARIEAWDISESSLSMTRNSLAALGLSNDIELRLCDAMAVGDSAPLFDSIVISEVLEHLEQPLLMLKKLKQLLVKGGLIFINFPVNSPAPDHIFLLKTPEQVLDLVGASGLRIVGSKYFPVTGYSEEKARKYEVTISCSIIAEA